MTVLPLPPGEGWGEGPFLMRWTPSPPLKLSPEGRGNSISHTMCGRPLAGLATAASSRLFDWGGVPRCASAERLQPPLAIQSPSDELLGPDGAVADPTRGLARCASRVRATGLRVDIEKKGVYNPSPLPQISYLKGATTIVLRICDLFL